MHIAKLGSLNVANYSWGGYMENTWTLLFILKRVCCHKEQHLFIKHLGAVCVIAH